ncbi:MAG: hypothetical protein WDN25_24840 [Acetobacteraceae bacterium]
MWIADNQAESEAAIRSALWLYASMTEPLPEKTSYEDAYAALVASEKAIADVCFKHLQPGPITYASLFGMGIGRRALALSSGFRSMVEQRNSLCALPMVRMQLDTALRLYAGFFVSDHQKFCYDVFHGAQINRMKSDASMPMTDKYLVDRVAKRNPWMIDVYRFTSGYIHFSNRHVHEVIRMNDGQNGQVVIGPNDFDRQPEHFLEPIRCIHHVNLLIEFALKDWFVRMCRADAIVLSATEVWGEYGELDPDE